MRHQSRNSVGRKRKRAVGWMIGLSVLLLGTGGALGAGLWAVLQGQPAQAVFRQQENTGRKEKGAEGKITDPAETAEEADQWNLILVNSQNPLPDDFSVNLKKIENGHAVDERIYDALQKMLADARAAGLQPLICSSYRTEEKQQKLFSDKVSRCLDEGYSWKEAEAEAAKWVARPRTSEHQTGLAVDIVDEDYQLLDEKQEDTQVQRWLIRHAPEYGFILRYPNEKWDITGIYYEPWHYRYVGKELAKEITEKNLCLEEYLSLTK